MIIECDARLSLISVLKNQLKLFYYRVVCSDAIISLKHQLYIVKSIYVSMYMYI